MRENPNIITEKHQIDNRKFKLGLNNVNKTSVFYFLNGIQAKKRVIFLSVYQFVVTCFFKWSVDSKSTIEMKVHLHMSPLLDSL